MHKSVITTLLLCLCATLGAQAQIDGGNWYDGEIVYSASQKADGKVRMHAMDEGEEYEYWLIPMADKKDTYWITRDLNNPEYEYHDVVKVRHLKENGLDVLCYYTKNDGLKNVMSNEKEWDAEKINKEKWLRQFYGHFVTEEESEFEKQIHWEWNGMAINGIIYPYKIVTFNGGITGHITIEHVEGAPNEMEGTWEVQPTLEGLLFSAVYTDDDTMPWQWVPTGFECLLREVNPGVGRFFYASSTLLNDKQFARLDKPSLRIMRNAILARHGYRFQSKDLQDYFSAEPWYKPAASNDNIRLSFIEQLNMQLISWEEAQNDE